MGVFVAPILVVLYIIPVLDPAVSPRPSSQASLFTVHIVSMLFAYASFALAFVLGLTYVLLFKEIKAKHLGFFYARLPSLQALDAMNARVVTVGWLFLTLGIAIGGIWATQIQTSSDPRAQAMGLGDPKILAALLCWGIYSFALFARRVIGWSGRRSAWLSAIAFVIVLLNFVPVGYFFTKSYNFNAPVRRRHQSPHRARRAPGKPSTSRARGSTRRSRRWPRAASATKRSCWRRRNRAEIYAVSDSEAAVDAINRFFRRPRHRRGRARGSSLPPSRIRCRAPLVPRRRRPRSSPSSASRRSSARSRRRTRPRATCSAPAR